MTRETGSQDRYRLLTVRQQWAISWLSRHRPNTRGLGRARPHTAVSATTMNSVSESAGHGRIRWRRGFVFPEKIEQDSDANSNSELTKVSDSLLLYNIHNMTSHPLKMDLLTPQHPAFFSIITFVGLQYFYLSTWYAYNILGEVRLLHCLILLVAPTN